MKAAEKNADYVLITGAESLLAKAYALDFVKQHQPLLLIGKPNEGLSGWSQQLTSYGVEVELFETDYFEQQNLELLADWIHKSYPVAQFLNLAQIEWMDELFEAAFQEKRVA